MKLIFLVPLVLLSFLSLSQNPLFIPDTLVGPTINLNLQNGQMNFFPGQATTTMGVNGNILGPTILLNKNQTVTMNVTNSLVDSTTIHWHGMHVSPENDGSPHIVIPPGTTWSPTIPVKDWAATYWYHPHLHMHTNEHVQKGIAGMIIVRDVTEAAINLPRKYGVDDFPIILQTKAFDSNNQIIVESALDTTFMANGTINPFLDVPSQVVRFRVLNGSSMRSYNLGLSNGQTFYQIASDGGLLAAPVALTKLMVSPGERVELLVNFTGMSGQNIQLINYAATLTEFPAGTYGSPQPGMGAGQTIPNYTLNPLNSSNFQLIDFHIGSQTANPVTTLPVALVNHTPWIEANSNNTRSLTFSPLNMGPTAIQGPFLINSTPFDMMTMNYTVPFGNTEIWTLTNNSPISHPFHLHNVPFYILDINGIAPPLNKQGRKDVILVPSGGGIVRIITKFEDFYNDTLPYMYHCHMLAHEDGGMMGQYIVSSPVNSTQELTTINGIQIYPNPTTDQLSIQGLIIGNRLTLHDTKGAIIESLIATSQSESIDMKHLESGIYFLKISSEEGINTIRIIKE